MEVSFGSMPVIKKANLDMYQETLEAGREYLAAKTPEEQQSAAEKYHKACANLPGAMYRTTEEFTKDFFSDVPIIL